MTEMIIVASNVVLQQQQSVDWAKLKRAKLLKFGGFSFSSCFWTFRDYFKRWRL